MYHGRPGLGLSGSLMSGVDWLRRDTAKRASMRPWTNTLSSGRKRCMTNTTTFTNRMNMPRTEATTLKVVVLRHVSVLDKSMSSTNVRTNVQLTPYHRRVDGSIVCVAVQHYTRVAVEALVCAVLPELCAVCVWVCDAEEGEDRHDKQELDHEEAVHEVGIAPVPGDEESRHDCRPV